jgi:hypothetical protein
MLTALESARVLAVGAGATLVMDAWLLGLRAFGVPVSNFALIGRWVGHWPRGRFAHAAIAQAAPVRHEVALGWFTHYAVGIAYAGLLVVVTGVQWLRQPTLAPALGFGLVTLAVPLFVMQPAMGAGLAGSRTAAPLRNVLRSVANHAVFGAGLYLAAVALAWADR